MRATAFRDPGRRPRCSDERGFTLPELLVVMLVVGVLMVVATSAYLSMRTRTQDATAEINVREALSAAELYYAERETYAGMGLAELEALDGGVRLSREPLVSSDGRRFCLESTHNGRPTSALSSPGLKAHSLQGPDGDVAAGACPAFP